MQKILSNLIYTFADVWKAIGLPQKVSIILITLITVAVLGGVIYMGSKPGYVVMYANMDSETAQKVMEMVEKENVEYKAKDGGATIMVPRKDVNRIKMKIRASGISTTGASKGWNLFDDKELGISKEQLRIKEKRAKQGELEQVIGELPGVARAKVEIAFPRHSVFLKKGKKPKASAAILVVMHPGRILTDEQINSIRYQVASSVEDLSPDDITISDNEGRLLAKRRKSNGFYGSNGNDQMEIRRQMEIALEEKAEEVLIPSLGFNNVIARVSLDLDFDRITTSQEAYDNDKKSIEMEEITSEETKKDGTVPSGAAGSPQNLTAVDPNVRNSNKSESTSSTIKQTTNKYKVPRSVTNTERVGVRVRGISVAVSIKRGEEARDPKLLEQYKKLVSSAVGAINDGVRADVVEVLEDSFVDPEPDPANKIPMTDNVLYYVEKALSGPILRIFFGFILLGIIYKIFRKHFDKDISHAELGMESSKRYDIEASDAHLGNAEMIPSDPIEVVNLTSSQNPELIASAMESWVKREER